MEKADLVNSWCITSGWLPKGYNFAHRLDCSWYNASSYTIRGCSRTCDQVILSIIGMQTGWDHSLAAEVWGGFGVSKPAGHSENDDHPLIYPTYIHILWFITRGFVNLIDIYHSLTRIRHDVPRNAMRGNRRAYWKGKVWESEETKKPRGSLL